MLMDLLTAPLGWVLGLLRKRPAGHLLQPTPSDSHLAETSRDMVQRPPDDRSKPPEEHSKGSRRSENGSRHEGHRSTGKHSTGVQVEPPAYLVGRLGDVESAYSLLVDEHKLLEQNHNKLSGAHRGLENNLHETQVTCKAQKREIDFLKEKLRCASALLDTRNRELKVANAFLSKEDSFSISEVLQFLRDLNSEIMQTATHLADNLAVNLKWTRNHPTWNIPEGPYTSLFVHLLIPRSIGDAVDAASLDLAFQGSLIIWVYLTISAWGFGQVSGYCEELYSKVRETGMLIC